MLYHFVYDPIDPVNSYAIFSDDMQHNIVWPDWISGKYVYQLWEHRTFASFMLDHPEFLHIATYNYPILPSEIIQLHPEYFI